MNATLALVLICQPAQDPPGQADGSKCIPEAANESTFSQRLQLPQLTALYNVLNEALEIRVRDQVLALCDRRWLQHSQDGMAAFHSKLREMHGGVSTRSSGFNPETIIEDTGLDDSEALRRALIVAVGAGRIDYGISSFDQRGYSYHFDAEDLVGDLIASAASATLTLSVSATGETLRIVWDKTRLIECAIGVGSSCLISLSQKEGDSFVIEDRIDGESNLSVFSTILSIDPSSATRLRGVLLPPFVRIGLVPTLGPESMEMRFGCLAQIESTYEDTPELAKKYLEHMLTIPRGSLATDLHVVDSRFRAFAPYLLEWLQRAEVPSESREAIRVIVNRHRDEFDSVTGAVALHASNDVGWIIRMLPGASKEDARILCRRLEILTEQHLGEDTAAWNRWWSTKESTVKK